MPRWFEIVGPERAVHILGVKLLGVNATTVNKLLLTAGAFLVVWVIAKLLRAAARAALRNRDDIRARFWSRQAIQLVSTVLLLIVVASIWFDRPGRFAASIGLVTAGLAVALQRVVTAVAAYFVILRGAVFNVGDRISMAGVRGDVIALGYTRTTIMEMGQPPPVNEVPPPTWVEARQYTGRIVTVTNDKIFDEPVFNYSREFPYIWDEIKVPVPHGSPYRDAEGILLEATGRHTPDLESIDQRGRDLLRLRYGIRPEEGVPRVYVRITDDWIELAVRFLAPDHGIRAIKDAISRDILDAFRQQGLDVASTTVALAKAPPVRVEMER